MYYLGAVRFLGADDPLRNVYHLNMARSFQTLSLESCPHFKTSEDIRLMGQQVESGAMEAKLAGSKGTSSVFNTQPQRGSFDLAEDAFPDEGHVISNAS